MWKGKFFSVSLENILIFVPSDKKLNKTSIFAMFYFFIKQRMRGAASDRFGNFNLMQSSQGLVH